MKEILKTLNEIKETPPTPPQPTYIYFLMWAIKWRCKQIIKNKNFFLFSFRLMEVY